MAATTEIIHELRVSSNTTKLVLLVCWSAILAEGYDIGVMGAIIPSLSTDPVWHLTPMQLGALSSYALIGMLIGAALIGTLSDIYGRRKMFIVSIGLFSATMFGVALSTSPTMFGVFRFIGGLGLGGLIPVAAALTIEYSPPEKRGFNYGVMYSGYSLGILCAALAAIPLLPLFGWRTVVGIGGFGVALIPILLYLLPESVEYLARKGKIVQAKKLAQRLGASEEACNKIGVRTEAEAEAEISEPEKHSVVASFKEIFGGKNLRATVCFWIALFLGLFMVYGLGSWLPQIMRKSGYDLGSSLSFLAVFSLASAIGGMVAGNLVDRFGSMKTISVCYLLGGIAIGLMSIKHSLPITYSLVAVAGFGTISASLVLTGSIAGYYVPWVRASATGWALGFARIGALSGPIAGGYLASLAIPVQSHFLVFAVAATLAAVLVFLVPERKTLKV